MSGGLIHPLLHCLDASAATVTFSLDGIAYEIDFSDTNAHTLRTFLEPWTPHARCGGKASRS
ncbi:Lsr2 dimerization domain-containing protein [Nocardia testacea]|uniref:Lsr2 dimerization domain-containing protein n=1 Tax=Nocardia testacea TaxID=248551 RepID=UPI0002E2D101|nr:histone-like nucleoid-structuring protein Lsr2 [Nocardia testacea]